ncbi:hypothetical protein V500_10539 [Pseudogymnoascus sp. VKM F-4518 (FW-2643)]|nr:hypothetical protein V500_10539 [Pseudogymnoascus sp. VKM F-4518 (FW-2643)]
MGIIGHYVADNRDLRESVLAFCPLHGQHTGENQSQVIIEVIKEYGIASKVGYFMMDNAENNKTMIRALSSSLLDEYQIEYNSIQHRLRCNGHIINLTAQAFLLSAEDNEALSYENNATVLLILSEQEMQDWRNKGPLRKLHNIYAMIDCAISIRMKPAIDVFCAQEGLEADALTPSDWTTLGHFHKYLKFFYQATLATEGYEATIDRVLSTIEFLLKKLEAAKVEFKEDAFLSPCVNSAWKKLDKYYGLTERSSAYTAAMVMVPS